ncbi:MAG TPA: hypothetical protein VH277_05230 [Gemmatimonadaceae bacterium]|jgi:hypothetical protein|nr:hypothetical protein [Gemmatimonadaceae bacterium]
MPADGFEGLEAMLGAIANLREKDTGLTDARCPKCDASDFAKASELYYDTIRRAENTGLSDSTPGQAGLTDEQIIGKFQPPRRRSAVGRGIAVAVPLGVVTYLVYRRFGSLPGQLTLVASIIITLIAFMTRVRRLSDDYYDQRHTWDHLYMCRKCGQLVSG